MALLSHCSWWFSSSSSSSSSSSILLFVWTLMIVCLTAQARAPAGDQRKYRTAYACEGSMLTLSCSENHEVINLLRANYGRFSITICNEHGDTDWSVNCMSHRSLRALHSKCNQQTNCSILASTNVFGDPCPGTLKYLEAHYQCVPATPTSSTARPRPPWFSSVGPSIWNTLGLQNASVSTTTTSNPLVLSTEQSDIVSLVVNNNSTSQTSTTAILEQNNGTSTTSATVTTSSSTSAEPSTTTTTPSTTTSTTSTTTPLPNLLVELTEVTVLVPDFPGRRPQSSSTPLPSSTSTLSVSGLDDDLVSLDDDDDDVDQENGQDQNGNVLTTPGSSTTAASSTRPKSSLDNKSQRPPGGVDHNMYCQPAVTRGLYWNWTRSGDHVVQPCPGGATGYARWYCSAGQGPAFWYPSSPDLSECKSVWLTSLDSRIGEGDSIISIANDLAQVTHSKTLYGGDMMAAARLLRQMALKMAADLQAFPDWRQREAIVTELVQSVVRAGSSLLGSSQSLAWRDLGLTTPPLGAAPVSPLAATRYSASADADQQSTTDPHYYATQQRDQHARTTATALLTGLEENAFLLANTISRQKSVFQSFDNILMSVRVLDMRNINELSFPSAEELQVWKSKEDWIILPAEALLENSDNGLVRVVLFAYEHMEDILSPASMNHQQHHHHHAHNRDQTGGSVSSPNRQQQQQQQHQQQLQQFGHYSEQFNATRIVNSRVISASLGKGRHIQLPQPVTIRFQHLRQDNVSNPTCVFWDYTVNGWSDEGCRVLATNRTHTQCRCDHLTNFAVLMDLHSTALTSLHQRALATITYIGCGISIVCLAVAVAIFTVCHSQLKSDRNTIHKNLCLSLLLAEIVFLSGINATHDRIVCGLVAGLLHFFFLCAFMWMLLEGFQLYVMLVEVFESDKSRVKWYYLCGYGVPVLIVAVSSIVDPFSYGTPDFCWLRADNYFIFSFVAPVILILAANFVFLGLAIWVMYRHQTTSAVMKSKEQSRLTNARVWIRGSFILVFLLGLTWTFGLLYLSESTVAMAYVFTILNSFQGFFIFFFHCFQDEQVRKDVFKALHRHGCLPSSCLSGTTGSSSNTSATSPSAGGKDNQTIFYGSSAATSAAATLTASDALTTATYMPQPWRGPTDVTLVTPQISNNNSSMRLNNTKNSQLRSSTRTLKQQPMVNSPHELENGSYKSYGRDSGNGSSEQDDSSPRQQQLRAQQPLVQQQVHLQQQQQQQQQQQMIQQQQQQQANGSMNRPRGNNYPHPVPNPALAEGAAMDAQLIAQFRDNTRTSPLRLAHHHQQHLRGSNKRSRSASPWNHTYMEIDLRRSGGARKTLAEETEEEESGMVSDPVYEEIERNAGCGGGDLCPCSNNQQHQLQRGPAVLHYQQASDLSDEDRRQNSSDVSRQSSRSYGDSRPLIPLQQQHHHHNHGHHHHQLSSQSQPGGGTHDLLTTISCAFNSPHLRTKHRHPSLNQFDIAAQHSHPPPIHMGFEGAPHFDADRYSQRPAQPHSNMYPYEQETGLTALSLMNGERIFVASGAVLEQQRSPAVQQRPTLPFTEC